MGGAFLAKKGGGVSLLACVSLIVAEVTAKDFPADLPFWMVPDDKEFAAAIGRTHREALQIVKDAIRTNALPVRRAQGIPRHCNQEADVIAWCDDTAAARPAAKLCGAREDMRGVFAVLGLQPPPELFANQDEWLAATESAQVEAARRSAMTQTVIERLVELLPPPAPSGSTEVGTGLEEPTSEQAEVDRKETGPARTLKPEESPEERGERIYRRCQELGGSRKKGVKRTLAQEEAERNKETCSESNIARILRDHKRRQESNLT